MRKLGTFLQTGWGAVLTFAAVLGVLAGIGPSIAAIRPYLLAPIFYVDGKLEVSDDALSFRLRPIRREQLEAKLDRIADRVLDLESQIITFEALMAKAETEEQREVLREQISTFRKRIDDLNGDKRNAACELAILNDAARC